MQFKDRNYLIPIDAAMGSEEDVTFFSVEVGQIFDRMDRAKTKFNFIILDACRDNPFAASFKTTSTGLAQMSSPSGTLIAYATAPGSVAADGFGRNGIYTKHILQNIKVPDVPVEIMFKRVREAVERETRKQQTPWDSSSLKGDFAFNSSSRPSSAVAAAAPRARRAPTRPSRSSASSGSACATRIARTTSGRTSTSIPTETSRPSRATSSTPLAGRRAPRKGRTHR
jgi:uncharacterized caspase-like protein